MSNTVSKTTEDADAADIADMLIEVERGRLQHQIDACLERHGGDRQAAVTGSWIGISYLFARDIVRALDYAEREIARLRASVKEVHHAN